MIRALASVAKGPEFKQELHMSGHASFMSFAGMTLKMCHSWDSGMLTLNTPKQVFSLKRVKLWNLVTFSQHRLNRGVY